MRIILHLDMDAFFASIEERENPKLRGMPIVIGADPAPIRIRERGGASPKDEPLYRATGRGVVSTASYAARKFGIHSALPISRAWALCPAPTCAYLPVDMKLYGIVSERIMKIVREVVHTYCHSDGAVRRLKNPVQLRTGSFGSRGSPQDDICMEQVSIDEAYVDVSFCGSYEKAEMLAQRIKDEIEKRERLTCSVGIGPNKYIAKIASDFKKPDGLTLVLPNKVQQFLDPLPVRKLPGVGPKAEAVLRRQGIATILDLRLSLPKDDELFNHAHGIDQSPVEENHEIKSIGHETTFEKDTRDEAFLTKTLLELCGEVEKEVASQKVEYRTITVRVRFDNFETHTSSNTLRHFTVDGTILKRNALKLLFPYFRNKRRIRLIGVRVSKLQ
ncbi:MAG: DNA polymerase IV [bacterium]|nr:DNA polymerase IV [bacterium]